MEDIITINLPESFTVGYEKVETLIYRLVELSVSADDIYNIRESLTYTESPDEYTNACDILYQLEAKTQELRSVLSLIGININNNEIQDMVNKTRIKQAKNKLEG